MDEYIRVCNESAYFLQQGNILPNRCKISIIASTPLVPDTFELGRKDLLPLYKLPPGKSAFLSFTRNVVSACSIILERSPFENERLFETDIKLLKSREWSAYFCPTKKNALHVRFFPRTMLYDFELDGFNETDILKILNPSIWRDISNI